MVFSIIIGVEVLESKLQICVIYKEFSLWNLLFTQVPEFLVCCGTVIMPITKALCPLFRMTHISTSYFFFNFSNWNCRSSFSTYYIVLWGGDSRCDGSFMLLHLLFSSVFVYYILAISAATAFMLRSPQQKYVRHQLKITISSFISLHIHINVQT